MQHQEPVTLTITHDSKIFSTRRRPRSTTGVRAQADAARRNDLGVVVNADSDAPEGTVVEAMIQARRAGVEHFLIAVKH